MIDGMFTLGVEEEYQIVHPETRDLRSYVSRLIEDGKSVLAHVHRIADDDDPDEDEEELPRAERFVVAEVSDGLIVRMCGYATEQEARDDLARPGSSE